MIAMWEPSFVNCYVVAVFPALLSRTFPIRTNWMLLLSTLTEQAGTPLVFTINDVKLCETFTDFGKQYECGILVK